MVFKHSCRHSICHSVSSLFNLWFSVRFFSSHLCAHFSLHVVSHLLDRFNHWPGSEVSFQENCRVFLAHFCQALSQAMELVCDKVLVVLSFLESVPDTHLCVANFLSTASALWPLARFLWVLSNAESRWNPVPAW